MTPAPLSGPDARPAARRLGAAVAAAALLWFLMFSPWTGGRLNFWLAMSASAVILTALALRFGPSPAAGHENGAKCAWPVQVLAGVAIAFALWGVFWIGDKAAAWMFGFARPEVDAVYAMKEGSPAWMIALLLLVLIGPAEEYFWRGYVQRTLGRLLPGRRAADAAFLLTTAVYALVHLWSFNFMLVMAALVAGAVWGLIYRLRPQLLPALILSHALWDALVFVLLPI
ncbi:MAG: CPBP family intramembrane metalloprotease [Bacteroidales bacterium]|nr:CPBP family intramembrane metalloprotease [Bacteroidales bacterium]